MPLWLQIALGLGAAWVFSGSASSPNVPSSSAMGNVQNLPASFWSALWAVASRLGASPYVLGLVLYEESGINPAEKNSIGCVGINQFCPGTYEYFVDMPPAQYLELSAEEQLTYVAKYWASKPRAGLASVRDVFWLSLTPVTWVPNADPSTVVNDPAKLGASYAAAVAVANPGIAVNGVITAGSIDAYLARFEASAGWQYAKAQLDAADPSGGASS
jgi:hypothetical protein